MQLIKIAMGMSYCIIMEEFSISRKSNLTIQVAVIIALEVKKSYHAVIVIHQNSH